METTYLPEQIEPKLQEAWLQQGTYRAIEDLNKEKFYSLAMFPYPSGKLHMGHVRNYTIGDVVSRYQRMLGKNVLQPFGWDAFGLPAENAALKHKTAPSTWTYQNIDQMRAQLQQLGFAYDWSREIATCKPEYYKWEQWFFLKLYERGLVYKKNAVVNWDPVDQTVLANEQVDKDGCGWRSGAKIERKEIPQWFIKITDYADELLEDLDKLHKWPDSVRTMQRNWIGKSQGSIIKFQLSDSSIAESIEVFTTCPDTLFGVSYLAIAPNHPISKYIAQNSPKISDFIESCGSTKVAEADLAVMEKHGIQTGITVKHPLLNTEVPLWIANFVLMEYGTGAVMAVPAHDKRDWEFAKKYDLPILPVIKPYEGDHDFDKDAFVGTGTLINSNEFDGTDNIEAKSKITDALVQINLGKKEINYRLRDWGVSRQRYWGTPIPIIYCDNCGTVPVPDEDLPVVLPEDIELPESGSALKKDPNFYETTCPSCQGKAERETDTFDTFMESSWYYTRYCSFNQDKAMIDERAKYWTPVDFYVGGVEHAVMHLLYARFFHKLMRDLDLLNSDEPFMELLTQGMVLKDGSKMSKSVGNTVDPQELIDTYGADTVRLFTIFASPPEQSLEWSDSGVEGAHRFLKRLWSYASTHADIFTSINETQTMNNFSWQILNADLKSVRKESHEILKQIHSDYERKQLNTVVSGAMKLLNLLGQIEITDSITPECMLAYETISNLLRVLTPITPHVCEKIWQELHFGKTILNGPWPKVSKEALKLESIEYVVQINGKLRGKITVSAQINGDDLINVVKEDEHISKHLLDKQIVKSIIVNNRKLINLVVK